MSTDNPGPLPDVHFRWFIDGKPTPEFYAYMRAMDKTMRTAVGVINTPDTPLPADLWNEYLEVACSDEIVPLTVGAAKVTFRMPYEMEVAEVRASLKTEQLSGTALTVDINQGGASILSTPITIDNGQRTSTTATTAPVIATATLSDDAEMTVDIDQVGDGTALGLKIILIGTRPSP